MVLVRQGLGTGGASDLGLARACGGRWWYGLGPARGLEWTAQVISVGTKEVPLVGSCQETLGPARAWSGQWWPDLGPVRTWTGRWWYGFGLAMAWNE
ncbi:hypothetical protein SLEP1_g38789 [Rubroshorea leprosula]|uniref:Uncharacterized protein n=1 Tax=Rubroshorea leprosula TaxID=152421 RepID=A0AAV5KYC2_9ROSI|nr:hypothetical protein SLEP1_g38789 [Rubroshorea leprosula]